jgi:HK97 family phage major capsid protein
MTHYPIGRGTSKPARLGTQDDFTFPIAVSAAITEKNLKLTNASLESHKGGGLLRLPREINEQGIIPLGQMLARYAARKFGKAEDNIAFLGDGTAPFDSIKGVCQIALDNNRVKQLGATKTAPSDATLEDWRALRPMCATPILSSGIYFAHATWERRFRMFKTQADPEIYIQNGPGGMATLDGYPIIWTEIFAPYAETANANAYIGIFGDLSYWWFGEHGAPRTDFSTDVFFTTDELAVRWLEEIDFDFADAACAAALRLAAA